MYYAGRLPNSKEKQEAGKLYYVYVKEYYVEFFEWFFSKAHTIC